MTLLFAHHDYSATIVAADQRLTLKGRDFIWDEQSSKLVVVLCTDGMAVIGYTGVAYVRNLPTDEYIARLLIDQLAPGQFNTMPGFMFGGKARPIRLGTTLKQLIDKLHGILRRQRDPFALVIAGQRRFKRRVFPFVSLIDRLDQSASYPSMRKGSVGGRRWAFAGDCGSPSSLYAIYCESYEQLRYLLPDRDPFEIRLHAIRAVFEHRRQTTHTVGDSLHLAIIRPGGVHLGMWRGATWTSPGIGFGGLPEAAVPVELAEMNPTVYSPWIVGGNVVAAPELGSGGRLSTNAWCWEIVIEQMFQPPPKFNQQYRLFNTVLPIPAVHGWGPARRRPAP